MTQTRPGSFLGPPDTERTVEKVCGGRKVGGEERGEGKMYMAGIQETRQ